MKRIFLPLSDVELSGLKAGDAVFLNGIVYTARDQAHKRLVNLLKSGRRLPFEIRGVALYYCGPTAAKPGNAIGSCGPTTSSRMDAFTPALLKAGLKVMIGKGRRSKEVIGAIKKYKAVYFTAIGGAGAFLSRRVTASVVTAFEELGPEAVRCLRLKDFPAIVAVDSRGRSIKGW